MAAMNYDMDRLRKLGRRRAAALAELEEVRQQLLAEVADARAAEVTWREIAAATNYTENRLQRIWADREAQ